MAQSGVVEVAITREHGVERVALFDASAVRASQEFATLVIVNQGLECLREADCTFGRLAVDHELALLRQARVFLCLGQYGYHSLWRHLRATGVGLPVPRPRFGHGVEIALADGRVVLLSYHPSQQNTFTGKLTRDMFDGVFARARRLTGSRRQAP